jgi:ribulose-phosphate 3-epimerase
MAEQVEIVPAILRKTFEAIQKDWESVVSAASHIQIDVTDGIFAGDGTWQDIKRFKQLPGAHKIELHMMVHTPGNYVQDILDLNPARCIFHIESFAGTTDAGYIVEKMRAESSIELGLAINPESPTQWLEEQIDRLHFVLFMGYNPGYAGQPLNMFVYNKIREFCAAHPDIPVEVDGHVSKETVEEYVRAGARRLAANTAIFGQGNPVENMKHLQLLGQAALEE